MLPYAVYINEAALATAPKSGQQRQMIMRFLLSLRQSPFQTGDFSESNAVGRPVQVKVLGRYAVTYWANHADSEVKITHIQPADK